MASHPVFVLGPRDEVISPPGSWLCMGPLSPPKSLLISLGHCPFQSIALMDQPKTYTLQVLPGAWAVATAFHLCRSCKSVFSIGPSVIHLLCTSHPNTSRCLHDTGEVFPDHASPLFAIYTIVAHSFAPSMPLLVWSPWMPSTYYAQPILLISTWSNLPLKTQLKDSLLQKAFLVWPGRVGIQKCLMNWQGNGIPSDLPPGEMQASF